MRSHHSLFPVKPKPPQRVRLVAGLCLRRFGCGLAAFQHKGIKADADTIDVSLPDTWRDEHLFALKQALQRYDCRFGPRSFCGPLSAWPRQAQRVSTIPDAVFDLLRKSGAA